MPERTSTGRPERTTVDEALKTIAHGFPECIIGTTQLAAEIVAAELLWLRAQELRRASSEIETEREHCETVASEMVRATDHSPDLEYDWAQRLFSERVDAAKVATEALQKKIRRVLHILTEIPTDIPLLAEPPEAKCR